MPSYKFGPFRLDTAERVLLRAGKPVPLAAKAYETLRVLVEKGGHVVTKDELMEAVWAGVFVEEGNLSQNIFKLRKALGEAHGKPRYIETVSGRGYRFIAKLKTEESAAASRSAAARTPQARTEGRTPNPNVESLAVLPLENATGNPGLEYLSDGITENLISVLSQLPRLRVTARATVFRLKGRSPDPIKSGRELGVAAVLTGWLTRVGALLVVRTELIATGDGRQLWGAQFSHQATNLFEVQEEIAREVSARLRSRLSRPQREHLLRRHTESVAAYRLYLKGRYYWNKRSEPGLRRALGCFRQALDEDPTYALAYVGVADCYDLLCGFSLLPPREGYPKARAAVLNALELDGELAEAHASLGHLNMRYHWDWATAEGAYRRALDLNPNYATAHHWYATYLTAMGRHEEAIAEGRRAQQLDPLSPIINLFIGVHFFFARRYEEALTHIRKTAANEPAFVLAHTFLAQAAAYVGNHDEALTAIAEAERVGTDKEITAILAVRSYCYAQAGRVQEARSLLAALLGGPAHELVNPFEVAQIHVVLGEYDEAFACLEKAYAERVSDLAFLKVAPELDPIRTQARFRSLLMALALTA